MLIFKKEKQVRKLILQHLSEVHECLMESRNALEEYTSGNVEAASEKARLVIEIESRADALEEQIREVLLQGAFLPHIRSDVYRLVEAVDAIAGEGESIARFVFDQSPLIPEQFESRLLDLYRLSLNCFLELRKALKDYFKPKGELEDLHEHVDRVCEIETEVDSAESMLARDIFASGLDLSEKIHLGQLVKKIGDIADLSEDASDELEFAAMKSVV
jgi:predicted phosphate transport protein (TIGR00153 family)